MGSVRTRPEGNILFFDFRWKGVRCREFSTLTDSAANRKRMQQMLDRIEAEMTLGTFDYAKYFPNSKNLTKFAEQAAQKDVPLLATSTENTAPTFAVFVETWWDRNQIRWRQATKEVTRTAIDRYLLPELGSKILTEITRDDLLNVRTKMSKAPGRNGNVTLSAKTMNHHMGVLRTIMADAAESHHFQSPFRKIEALKVRRTQVDPFNLAEVKSIIDNVRADYRDYMIVRFFTGVRTGELHGLKWCYVDFDRRQILVRETFSHGRAEYTKTDGSQREIEMTQVVYDALKRQREATGKKSQYVFCTQSLKPIDTQNFVDRVWHPLLRFLQLRARRPYQTRHTCATLWLASGENPEWIARQLGHANTEMLFTTYSRYVPNLTRKDGSAFERLINESLLGSTSTKSDNAESSH
eukprot:TRINITY_DN8707_c0_g1_i1.p1 TRINITY_DN8707_c0_g1~~TRINITY_DN8707_c0_g1_i1.p1  ORF type:complete len:421 (-),score=94.82 TRINITY_DN8707_c0_g1_i1:647-1876(-)